MRRWIALLTSAGLAAALVSILWGCGPGSPRPSGPAAEAPYADETRTAWNAFERGRYEEAAVMYRKALDRAYVNRDAASIADMRYNLAVSLMNLYQYEEAMHLVVQAREELARQNLVIPPELLLLEAALYYRMGRAGDARAAAERILSLAPSPGPDVGTKALFIQGLAASDLGDVPLLRSVVSEMAGSRAGPADPDRAELLGRLALAEGRWLPAAAHFEDAASLRRRGTDVHRIAMALALSAEAYEPAGRPGLSALRYLQAGRGALLAGDRQNARIWLSRAEDRFERLGAADLAGEARRWLSSIEAPVLPAAP